MPEKLKYEVEYFLDLPFYTEGPVVDTLGNRYITTLTGGSILKIDPDNSVEVWAKCKCPNGQFIMSNNDHIVCDTIEGAVKRFDGEGNFIRDEIKSSILGVEIGSPNDVIGDSHGNIYFTDSTRHIGKLCFIGINGQQKILLNDLDYPNGLVLNEALNILYLAESYKNRIIKLDLITGIKSILATLPFNKSGKEIDNLPDGMAMDSKGNLWIAHYGMGAIQKLDPSGSHLSTIHTEIPLSSNLTFKNNSELLLTGGFSEPGPGCVKEIRLI